MNGNNYKTITSNYSFLDTANRLKQAITAKNMTIFAVIDHQQSALQAGLTMQPATVIIYGNPKAGTPLMLEHPSFALKLPLKVLVTEIDNKVQVIFETTQSLIADYSIDFDSVEETLVKAEELINVTVR